MTSTTQDGRLADAATDINEEVDQGRLLPDGIDEEEPKRGSGRLRKIGIVCLAVGLAVVAWYLSELVTNRSGPPSSQLPVLTSGTEPIKSRPDDPGGADIPNRDKYVYKSLETPAAGAAAPQIEQILPGPEEPMEKTVDLGPVLGPLASVSLGEAWRTPLAADTAAAPSSAGVENSVTSEATASPAEQTIDALTKIAPAAGSIWVQLASLRDEKGAASEWSRLSKKYPAAFKGMEPKVDKADLGEKGVWFRLRAGPYADKAAAERACKALQAAGQACKLTTL